MMDPHDDGARTPRVHPRTSGGTHDRCGVPLTEAEQRCFDEIVAVMWTLRMTRGRRSAIFGRDRTCLIGGIVGLVISVVSLGVLPLVVSFAGFVIALVASNEFSRNAVDSGWWRRLRQSVRSRSPRTTR